MDGSNHPILRFVTTAKASADAHALARVGLAQIDLVVDAAALVLAMVLLIGGNLLGLLVAAVAGLSLVGSRFHPFQRALIAVRFRNVLGRSTEVTIDDEGVRFENDLATLLVAWSSITAVRSNDQIVAFFRDRLLVGYVPAAAFASPAAQADAVAFARSRITAGR